MGLDNSFGYVKWKKVLCDEIRVLLDDENFAKCDKHNMGPY